MCGIAGIISTNTNIVRQTTLQQMTDAIIHRGPEGDGFWINKSGTVGFGHRRLAIIDLSPAGAQPMHYMDRYTITYNGELYNYIELREQLKKQSFVFNSDCDTEVILAAYACYGKDCLKYFDGMFAFAIWDEQEQTLFCARDRFGEKPFYYYDGEESMFFGSEMKALWAAGAPKEMNNSILLNYLTIGYTSDPTRPYDTFYNEINIMPPAHYMILKMLPPNDILGYEFDVVSYWDLDKETEVATTEDQAIETFSQLFQTSVARRLRSDVPIGSSLSGGLDSSSIVATANEFLKSNNNYQQASFSAVFPGYEKDESKQIRSVALKFNLKSFTTTPTSNGLIHDFQKFQYHQEEPFQSSSIYAQYKVYELAKEHGVTVLLDGQGADEIVAGYHKYYHWYWQELIRKSKFKIRNNESKNATQLGVNVQWGFKNYLAAFFPTQAAEALKKQAYKSVKNHPHISADFVKAYEDETSLDKPVVEKLN
ncbi:MAG TPA: asparagine synthase (glutamine-hydrolyzing), partial [Segetibacter sp.]